MANKYSFKIPAHYNIYSGSNNRELRIDFSVPDKGVNSNTGLLIFVPGFGANIDSNVYKKMREVFADMYNLVTIQCEYFGSRFMQSVDHVSIHNEQILRSIFSDEELYKLKKDSSIFLNLLQDKNIDLQVKANIKENIEEFNDMGFMQAIDIISAIEAVKIILRDNKLQFNNRRMIGYGHSHGAYLLHLSNALVPSLFSFIIDNSGWIEPVYLYSNRLLYQRIGKCTLSIEFDYIAKNIIKNKAALNMENFYKNYNGNTQILTFQGNNDNLINHVEKQRLINNLNNSKFILVTEQNVDNKKFKSNRHGLEADFLELFSYSMKIEKKSNQLLGNEWNYRVNFNGIKINIINELGLPVFQFDGL